MTALMVACLCAPLAAQQQNNQWRFGYGSEVDFNTTPPTCSLGAALPTLSPPFLTGSYIEGTASVADRNTGALLFYTDGWTVWDAQDQPMPNGTGLDGSTYLSAVSGAVIVPMPQSCSMYYVFTVGDQEEGFEGVKYSVVDMTLNNGLGDVVPGLKGILLYQNQSEMLNVVVNADQDGYWLLTSDFPTQQLAAFEVTASGVSTTPVLSPVGTPITFKSNRQGTKIIAGTASQDLALLDFDAATGQASDPIGIPLTVPGGDQLKYYEFSPSGQYLYATSDEYFYRLDVSSNNGADILASATNVLMSNGSGFYGQLQLGPDGKLYVVTTPFIQVINDPDDPAAPLGPFGQLPTVTTMACLPQLIDVLPEEAPIGSITTAADDCAGAELPFSITSNAPITSVTWNFGDPGSGASNSSTALEPTHVFAAAGSYTVTAVVAFDCATETLSLPLTIVDCGIPDTLRIEAAQGTCAPDTVEFSIRTNLLIEFILGWDFGDPASGADNTSLLGAPTHVYSDAGSYTVSCIVQVNCSDPPSLDNPITTPCFYVDTIETTVTLIDCTPPDTLRIMAVQGVCAPDTVEFSIDTNLAIGSILGWDLGDPLSGADNTSFLAAPTHVYSNAGSYTVSCIVQVDCSEPATPDNPITTPCFYVDTLETTISLLDCAPADTTCHVHVPNVFTPNVDGINDSFGPLVACSLQEYRFVVLNRWGQEVHVAARPEQVWDGNHRGMACPDGVYAYIVEYKGPAGRLHRATGHVTLLR